MAVVEAAPEIEAFRPALGVSYCDLDRPDGRELFEEDVADGFARYRHNGLWLASMAMNAEIAAYFDHAEAASVLYDALWPWRDQVVWTGTTAGRSVALAVGLVAATLGRFGRRRGAGGPGLDVHRRLGAPAWTAESLVAVGLVGPDPPGTRVMLDRARRGAGRGEGAGRRRSGRPRSAARSGPWPIDSEPLAAPVRARVRRRRGPARRARGGPGWNR